MASLAAKVEELTAIIRQQAETIARLTAATAKPAEPDPVPSVACIYWLYTPTRWHERSWRHHWNRLKPVVDHFGDKPYMALTPMAWTQYLVARSAERCRGTGRPPCDYTTNIELARAKEMLSWAVDEGIIPINPLARQKYAKVTSRRETRLVEADIKQMLFHAEQLRDRRLEDYEDNGVRAAQIEAFILCCYDSMLRFNETRHLRRDHIAVDGDVQVRGKGDKLRNVRLTPRTMEAIARVPAHPDTHYVFANHETGALLGESTIRGWFRRVCSSSRVDARAAARDRRIVPHILRHSGATAADEAGARPGAIQDALGHASARTTQVYLHREKSESARHVAEAMTDAIRQRRGRPAKPRVRELPRAFGPAVPAEVR
jgi:integrase